MYLVLTSSVCDVCTTTYVSSSLNLEAENSGSDRAEEGSCISVWGCFIIVLALGMQLTNLTCNMPRCIHLLGEYTHAK